MNTSSAPISTTPKDIFLHLLNIVTFYVSAISYITLLIQYINLLLPDPLNYYHSGILESIFWSTSIIVVAFPCYIFTSWLMERDFSHTPAKRNLSVRKWLIYATLFIASVTILGDLVALVFNFLKGELSLRFFLKVIVVLTISTAVFGYYFWDLHERDKKAWITRKRAAVFASSIVLISIVLGFVIAGTPGQQRSRRFDERRINDLQMLQGQILDYWMRKGTLPQQSQELENALSGFTIPHDPDTKTPYEYKQISDLSFEICAQFQTDSGNNKQSFEMRYMMPKSYPDADFGGVQTWDHSLGRTCFTRTIDPDLYKQPEVQRLPIPAMR